MFIVIQTFYLFFVYSKLSATKDYFAFEVPIYLLACLPYKLICTIGLFSLLVVGEKAILSKCIFRYCNELGNEFYGTIIHLLLKYCFAEIQFCFVFFFVVVFIM